LCIVDRGCFIYYLHAYVFFGRVSKPLRSNFNYNEYDFRNIKEVLDLAKKQNKNSVAAQQRKKENKSLKDLIESRRWPEGGLQQLR